MLFRCVEAFDPTTNISYCEWDYSGQGIEYQVAAGPIYVVISTCAGVALGFAGDKMSRTKLMGVCVVVFSVCSSLMAFVQEYWHLLILRMGIAAG